MIESVGVTKGGKPAAWTVKFMDPLIAEWNRDFRVYAVHNENDKNNIYEASVDRISGIRN